MESAVYNLELKFFGIEKYYFLFIPTEAGWILKQAGASITYVSFYPLLCSLSEQPTWHWPTACMGSQPRDTGFLHQ